MLNVKEAFITMWSSSLFSLSPLQSKMRDPLSWWSVESLISVQASLETDKEKVAPITSPITHLSLKTMWHYYYLLKSPWIWRQIWEAKIKNIHIFWTYFFFLAQLGRKPFLRLNMCLEGCVATWSLGRAWLRTRLYGHLSFWPVFFLLGKVNKHFFLVPFLAWTLQT